MKEGKRMKEFNTSGTKTYCIPLENPERVRRGRRSRNVKRAGSKGG